MIIRGVNFKLSKIFWLSLYYGFAQHLPGSFSFLGKTLHTKDLRYFICKHIFYKCGTNVNIEKGACFGSGKKLEIGDNSGIGIDCVVPSNIVIGENVMMGPNVYILAQNHNFQRIDIPIIQQGFIIDYKTIIEDDVWIGRNVTMTPGRVISKGSIIGACCLLCKDFPAYSIIGGNPSRIIRSRIEKQ